jgi:hypothetical protein
MGSRRLVPETEDQPQEIHHGRLQEQGLLRCDIKDRSALHFGCVVVREEQVDFGQRFAAGRLLEEGRSFGSDPRVFASVEYK